MAEVHPTTHHHIIPFRVYFAVGAALLVLTAATVMVAKFDFGAFNLLVAILIAVSKASLVALYFMHLKYDNRLYMVVFLVAIFALGIFIILTLFDTLGRDQIDELKGKPIREEAVIYQKQQPAAGEETVTVPVDTAAAQDTVTGQ